MYSGRPKSSETEKLPLCDLKHSYVLPKRNMEKVIAVTDVEIENQSENTVDSKYFILIDALLKERRFREAAALKMQCYDRSSGRQHRIPLKYTADLHCRFTLFHGVFSRKNAGGSVHVYSCD